MRRREELSELVVKTWNRIHYLLEKDEEDAVHAFVGDALTLSEIHLISAVTLTDRCSMGYLAETLDIKNSTITAIVNRLISKGFLTKERCKVDGRTTIVNLTKNGELINDFHRRHHQNLASIIIDDLDDRELELFLGAERKLLHILELRSQNHHGKIIYKTKDWNNV